MKNLMCFCFTFFLVGCGSNPSLPGQPDLPIPVEPSAKLISSEHIETRTPGEIVSARPVALELGKTLSDEAGDGETLQQVWQYIVALVSSYAKYPVHSYKVIYRSQDANGQDQILSGLVVVPYQSEGQLAVPVMSIQHPTQVLREFSPSMQNLEDNELSYQSALLLAATGYLVIVSDYPGLGVNLDPHPYCHSSLAIGIADLIEVGSALPQLGQNNTSSNGQLYLMGYSEGGYATVVAARELQNRGITPNAAVALDGPHSLSETMRGVILNAGPDFNSPYFLPYVLAGYDEVYGATRPQLRYDQAVLNTVTGYTPPPGSSYGEELRNRLDGSFSADQISDFMKLVQPFQGPRSILQPDFLAMMQNPNSVPVQTLAENDSFRNWTPRFPLKFFHNSLDDVVPVQCSRLAVQAFASNPNVSLEEYLLFIPGLGSVHAGAFPVALIKGFDYLDNAAYPNR